MPEGCPSPAVVLRITVRRDEAGCTTTVMVGDEPVTPAHTGSSIYRVQSLDELFGLLRSHLGHLLPE